MQRIILLLVAGLLYVCLFQSVATDTAALSPWYRVSPDYKTLAASHALFWESRFAGEQTPATFFQVIHPGIPFQLSSWLIARVGYFDSSASLDQNTLALLNRLPEFDRDSLRVALCLQLFALLVATRFTSSLSTLGFATSIALLGCYWHALKAGTQEFSNESFAQPLILCFGLLWLSIAQSPAIRNCLLVGILSGVAYLLKLNYLVLGVSSGVLILSALPRTQMRQTSLNFGGFALGMFSTVVGLGWAALGMNGLRETLLRHRAVFLKADLYGTGSAGIADPNKVWRAVEAILGDAPLFVATLLTLLSLAGFQLLRYKGQSGGQRPAICYLATLCVATCGFTLAALKHYQPHYLVPVVPLLFLIGVSVVEQSSAWTRWTLVSLAFLSSAHAAVSLKHFTEALRIESSVVTAELQKVYQLPLAASELRIWTYQTRSAPAVVAQLLLQAGKLSKFRPLFGEKFPQEGFVDLWNQGIATPQLAGGQIAIRSVLDKPPVQTCSGPT